MFSKFQPTWQVESIYDLPPEELRKKGIKVVLTDLDNTLIAWNNPEGTPQLREWLQKMEEAKIPVVVVSHNSFKTGGSFFRVAVCFACDETFCAWSQNCGEEVRTGKTRDCSRWRPTDDRCGIGK